MWRAADILWQLEKADVRRRPSSREMSPDLRTPIDDENMKLVMKKFPHTKWADLAAYQPDRQQALRIMEGRDQVSGKRIRAVRKICARASAVAQGARKRSSTPRGDRPRWWRCTARSTIKKSDKAHKKAMELAQEVAAKSPAGDPKLADWKPRATELIYALQQGIPTYTAEPDRK